MKHAITRHPILLILLIAFAASPVLSRRLNPQAYDGGRSRDLEARASRNASSVGIMFGEVRTAISDIMMIKTERYLHSGIAYVPKQDQSVLSVTAAMESMDAHQAEMGAEHDPGDIDLNDAGSPTVIRGEEEDFRGFIGNLHREVAPYQHASQEHDHTDGRELLPWFRVMTLSDPNFVQGYATGSWWLKSREPDEALAFADEGIRNNPRAFQIYVTKGQILILKARRRHPDIFHPDEATHAILMEAVETYHAGAAQAESQWKQLSESASWNDYMADDAAAAMRMSAMMEWQFGDPAKGIELATRYLGVIGEDEPLRRLANRG